MVTKKRPGFHGFRFVMAPALIGTTVRIGIAQPPVSMSIVARKVITAPL